MERLVCPVTGRECNNGCRDTTACEDEVGRYLTRANLFSRAIEGKPEAEVRLPSTILSPQEAEESAKKLGVKDNDFITAVVQRVRDALD